MRIAQEARRSSLIMEENYIVIDTETTGLNAAEDELLQVSIIDNEGAVLFDSYIRPTQHTEWAEAERVNHITPEMVADAPTIAEVMPEINDILKRYDKIVGYNVRFDADFLKHNGAKFLNAEYADAMKMFAPIYGEWNDQRGSYKWQKLTIAADYYGYDWSEHKEAHNSLGDCYATLYVYKKLTTDTMTIERVIDGKRVGIELTPAEISQAYYIKESDDRRQDILNALDEMDSLKIGNIDISKDFLKNSTTFIDDVIYRYEKMDDHLEDYNLAIEDVLDNAADNYANKLVSNYVQTMSAADKEQFIESAEMAMDWNDTNEPAFSKIEHMVYNELIDERRREYIKKFAAENGIPFSENIDNSLDDEVNFYVYDGSMSPVDFEKWQLLNELSELTGRHDNTPYQLIETYEQNLDFNTAKKKAEELLNNAEISEKAIKMVAESRYMATIKGEKSFNKDRNIKPLSPFLDNHEQNEVLDMTGQNRGLGR